MLVINPGSRIGKSTPKGWTNTFEKAQAEAERWLKNMHEDDGLTDVELVRSDPKPEGGRWKFTFRHRVTGVEVTLDTHGISDLDAYCKQYIFAPKVYWKGSSCSNPQLDDFAAPGFRKLATFVRYES